jgi:hypothetical protein
MKIASWFVLVMLMGARILAQAPAPGAAGRGNNAPPRSPRDAAPIDLTGYWVSLVTEDWRWRMVTPLKGDSASVPVNRAGKQAANEWDPARDEAAGLQCKSYGAAAIMRVPGRLHVTWQDEGTLKIETDAGVQTRLLRFSASPETKDRAAAANTEPSWQGLSSARWEAGAVPPAAGIPLGLGPRVGMRSRSLEVVTTNLRAGYLRKNGVPYSERTKVTEYFDRFSEPDGSDHLMVLTIVEDPVYLAIPFVTSSDFKKEPDGSKWDPAPCSAR